jgi:hypothetical protein
VFKFFADKPNPYKECRSCTLPYIDKVNGRNGLCDFCAEGKNAPSPSRVVPSPPFARQLKISQAR